MRGKPSQDFLNVWRGVPGKERRGRLIIVVWKHDLWQGTIPSTSPLSFAPSGLSGLRLGASPLPVSLSFRESFWRRLLSNSYLLRGKWGWCCSADPSLGYFFRTYTHSSLHSTLLCSGDQVVRTSVKMYCPPFRLAAPKSLYRHGSHAPSKISTFRTPNCPAFPGGAGRHPGAPHAGFWISGLPGWPRPTEQEPFLLAPGPAGCWSEAQ